MSLIKKCLQSARTQGRYGLLLPLLLAAGCHKVVPSGAPKPKTDAAKPAVATGAQTNMSEEYVSVFEDLPPKIGKDPFFPGSHRRDPAPETVAADNTPAAMDAELALKAVMITAHHSEAVINNEVFEKGEVQPVRVPSGHVRVKCLDIGVDFVLIQVEGESEPKRLAIQQKKY
jgi:hypothetical protein